MKRPATKQLRTRPLDQGALRKVGGGRGTYCGNVIHCECGYVFAGDCSSGYGIDTCPFCGESTL